MTTVVTTQKTPFFMTTVFVGTIAVVLLDPVGKEVESVNALLRNES
jgi:hypothetical protein